MNVYEMVTERIIDQLEKGYIPWLKPWANCLDGTFNRITKKPYSLMNQMLLQHDGEYATFKQWEQLGGKVKKNAKAEIVIFWKMREEKIKDENGEEKIHLMPLLRYYNVFHISQVDGVEALPKTEEYQTEPIEAAETLLFDYLNRENIKIHITESDRAFYRPFDDSITLPELEQFKSAEAFYSTAFHEATHSTLKATRCDRTTDNKDAYFGNESYSKEELVAELGSSAILNFLGIETEKTFQNTTAYIQNWISVLKNDKKFIISASGKAEKAVNYILGNSVTTEEN